MSVSFNIAYGVNDACPKKNFFPRHLRLKSRSESLTGDSLQIYKPLLEFDQSFSRGFPFNSKITDDGQLIWFTSADDTVVRLNSVWYNERNQLSAEKSWKLKAVCDRKGNRDRYVDTVVSFSPDLSFGLLVHHVISKKMFKPKKSRIEISLFESLLENGNKGQFIVHEKLLPVSIPKVLSHFLVCLSPMRRYVVLCLVVCGQIHTDVLIFEIEPNGDKYQLKQLTQLSINCYINDMKFNQFEDTLLLLGAKCFYVIYPLDSPHPSETKFYGCDPYMIYDNRIKTEFLFSLNKDRFCEVDIYRVRPSLRDYAGSADIRLFDYEKIRNLEYDELKYDSGCQRVFHVHHYRNVTKLFLGFADTVYVFDPFSCRCLYMLDLSCTRDLPFFYSLDTNWSGKEISIFCWDNFDYVSLKLYHLEDEKVDISLKNAALAVVQATYSLNSLRKMQLPKSLRTLLGIA